MKLYHLPIVGGLALVLIGVAAWLYLNRQQQAESVLVQLDWIHGADFAGYYAADQNGDYAAAGLTVDFLVGGPKVDPVAPVLAGKAQFATATAHHLLHARAQGKPVRAIACIFRRSPFAFVSLADAEITHPSQFAGKTIRLSKQAIPLLNTLMDRFDVAPESYTVMQTRSLDPFYAGEIDIWGGYLTGAIRQIKEAGHRIDIIHPDNFGVHSYHECLFTTDALITADPDLVRRFLKATLKGWHYALNHPVETGLMTAKYNPDAEATNETAHLRAARPLFNTGEDHIGWMKPEVWSGMAITLQQANVLTEPIDVTQAYTLQFLREIYVTNQ